MFSVFLGTLGAVDLAIDLSGNSQLLHEWYSANSTLPILSHFQRFVLPLAMVGLLAKIVGKVIPGVRAGDVGATFGLAPLVLIPAIIVVSVRAKKLLQASQFQPDAADLQYVTRLHAVRSFLSLLMLGGGISENALKMRAALKAIEVRTAKLL